MEPCRPSPPGGIRGTGGPGRAGTAAAEGRLLGWTGDEGEEVQTVAGGDESVEEGVTAGRELETRGEDGRAEPEGAGPLFESGTGGRDVGLERGEEAGPAGRGGEGG